MKFPLNHLEVLFRFNVLIVDGIKGAVQNYGELPVTPNMI
jgi:hypothetical protein